MDAMGRIMNPYNIDITVTNLSQSAETRSSVAIRVENLMYEYMTVHNGPSTIISSYPLSHPQLVNFDITSTTTSSEIVENIYNQLGMNYYHLSNNLASQIFRKANDMDLERNAIFMDVFVTISNVRIYFSGRTLDEEGDDDSVVEKLVQDGVIGEKFGLETESCSICLENLLEVSEKVPTRMSCSHVFHDRCISQWLRRKNSCPLCRQVLFKR